MLADLTEAANSLLENKQTEEERIYADMRKLTPAQRLEERMALKAYAKKAKQAKRNQDRLRAWAAKNGVKLPAARPKGGDDLEV